MKLYFKIFNFLTVVFFCFEGFSSSHLNKRLANLLSHQTYNSNKIISLIKKGADVNYMNKSKLFGKNIENLFQSKSTMLKLLQNNLKQSKIEKIYDFTVQEWSDNQKFILKNISQKFFRSNLCT